MSTRLTSSLPLALLCVSLFAPARGEDRADSLWRSHVAGVLQTHCLKCHNAKKASSRLDLSSAEKLLQGGKRGPAVKPGDPQASLLYQVLQKGGKPHMPPGGKQLNEEELAILRRWIERLGPQTVKTEPAKTTSPASLKTLPPGVNPTTVIDLLVEARWTQRDAPVASRCDDRTFARRIHLDLLGRIPTPQEAQRFLQDTHSDKRQRLVDELLQREHHAVHLADVFDALLMGRGDSDDYQQRRQHGWKAYLENAFRKNRPWNHVAHEVLLARPAQESAKGATWFLYARKNKHQDIAEAIAPAFFGVRVECAQCHDHPLADEIKQQDYWGLVAFFRRGKNANTPNGPRVSESAIGGFESFADLSGQTHPNSLTFFGKTVDEPRPAEGAKQKDEDRFYQPAAVKNDPRKPTFSRRRQFVDKVLADHPLVARAMVNRIWALLLGRGFVHPFDKLDSAHPPSHPELLDWLSQDFQSNGYDTRRLIRHIVLSRPYQLESRQPSADSDPADFSWSLEKPLIAETWLRSISQLVRNETAVDGKLLDAMRRQFPEVLPEEYVAKLPQAMFLSNGEALNQYLATSRDTRHITPQLLALPNHSARVKRLFTSAFHREPTQEESERATAFLDARQNRLTEALDALVWAVIVSAEFRLNH